MRQVKATRNFSNAHVGSREKGEKFAYDYEGDPGLLRRDGHVELATTTKAAKSTSKPSGSSSSKAGAGSTSTSSSGSAGTSSATGGAGTSS